MIKTITKEELLMIIKEELTDIAKQRQKHNAKRQKQREKDADERSNKIFRDTEMGRLARGIMEEPVQSETVDSIEDANYKLAKAAKIIQSLQQENEHLKAELAKRANHMSWGKALDTFNAMNKAEKGDLHKPDTK